jgi:hypothetical protein
VRDYVRSGDHLAESLMALYVQLFPCQFFHIDLFKRPLSPRERMIAPRSAQVALACLLAQDDHIAPIPETKRVTRARRTPLPTAPS